VADINEGQMAEEEIHGGMKSAVIDYSYDNKGVADQCQDIENKEHGRYSNLHLQI
jgi:hypothetical protein